jgi:hypothetical protein
MNNALTFRIPISLYVFVSTLLVHRLFYTEFSGEAAAYMKVVYEVNGGFSPEVLLSKLFFCLGHLIGVFGVVLLLFRKKIGVKPIITGESVAFLGTFGALPKYLPSVFTTETILILASTFFVYGVVVCIALINPNSLLK